ncbi:hypothetical protein ACFWIV_27270 [Streptomyces virginiae]
MPGQACESRPSIARHALAGHLLYHLGGRSYFEMTVDLVREKSVTVVPQ